MDNQNASRFSDDICAFMRYNEKNYFQAGCFKVGEWLKIGIVLVIISFFITGCVCEDRDDVSHAEALAKADDDSSDDDNNDSTDDDDDDDDNDDNDDDDDNDDNDVDTGFYWKPDIYVQYIEGGIPGEDSTDIAVGPDDTMYVVADKGRTINLYTKRPDAKTWETETIAYLGYTPEIAANKNGKLHICYMYVADENPHLHGNLMYITNESGQWQITTVDDVGVVGEYCSIALDDSDNVHISYFDHTNESLKFATNTSGAWITETAITGGAGANTSIAIDSDGFAHVLMNTWPWSVGYLLYATNETGTWGAIVMAHNAGPSSIAIDPNDFVHIVHYGANNNLHYQHNDSGSWVAETIDFAPSAGQYPSIVVDQDGFVHVSYEVDGAPDVLKYATNKFGPWLKVKTSQTEEGGVWSSISLNSDNFPCISHHARLEDKLKVTTFEGSAFVTETIDEGPVIKSKHLDMAVGLDEFPRISYSPSLDGIELLSFAIREGVNWNTEVVAQDSDSWFGIYNSIAIDSDGFAHISYLSASLSLDYATNISGDWILEELENDVDNYTFIETDNADHIHTLSSGSDGVKYLSNASGSWLEQIIDPLGLIAGSLVLDENGNAFVTYYIEIIGPGDEIYFATNESGSWETVLLDDYGSDESSIALDSNGFSHIVYCDRENDGLKYATNVGGKWDIIVLDSELCNSPYIALDQQEIIHIIWEKDWVANLVYTTNISGSWASITDILPGNTGRCKFSLDENGMMHIVFNNLFGLWYAKIPTGYTGDK